MVKEYAKKLGELLGLEDVYFDLFYNDKLSKLHDYSLEYIKDENKPNTIYARTKEGATISSFSLSQLHGCCGVCISYHSFVCHDYRNKGVASLLNQMRQEIGKYLGYSLLICTDVVNNLPQSKILEKNEWKHVHRFQNKRTNNLLNLSVINL